MPQRRTPHSTGLTRLPKSAELPFDPRRLAIRVFTVLWLTALWCLLWGNLAPGTIAGGVLLSLVILLAFPLPRVPIIGRVRLTGLLRLGVRFVLMFIRASVDVAWLAVRPAKVPPSAVLGLRMNVHSDFVLALSAGLLNLLPGGVVMAIDQVNRVLYMHVLHGGSDAAIRRTRREAATIERLLKDAFEREGDVRSYAVASGAAATTQPVTTQAREEN